ncbi:MAG: gamma-glutamyltransferase family protein [Rhodospirillaceae bacterium]|jgi:gamma-glutamyltranspeptidase / glutathione hydrolase|nr:gamma-glutamyltransferase family protein [Rhodospirillaceae bacterium]
MAVLEHGGNAFDAAVAMGFALQVVEPHMNGPAGEVPALFRKASSAEIGVLSGQGPAPAKATPQAYRDLGLDRVPGTGMLPLVVPGAFDAWMTLLRDHGTMKPRDVLKYAIGYARDGFAIAPNCASAIELVGPFFEAEWPTSAALHLPGGNAPKAGELFKNPALAAMYGRLLKEAESVGADRDTQIEAARECWYQGFIAEAIDAFCQTTEVMDTSGRKHKALLTGADMAGYKAHYETPVTLDYPANGEVYTVAKPGPWTQGPVMLQQLALLKGFPLADMDPTGADFVHTIMECAKLAFADRETYYGDPAYSDVPLEHLLSDAYATERRALVGNDASYDFRPGEVAGFGQHPELFAKGSTMKADDPESHEYDNMFISQMGQARGDTCHLDVIDKWGNMVAATPSGGWLSSSPAIPDLGFCLSTRGQMFWIDEGHPDCIAPGKRPRITLSPSMALRDGEPYMAFGTPGGDQQDQWPLHMFLRHVHHGMNLQQAIDAPNFHSTHCPGSFYPREWDPAGVKIEGRFSDDVLDDLQARGHRLYVEGDWALGRVSACARDGDLLMAAANPRLMQGYAAGR